MKAQPVRLADVFGIGPLMIAGGFKLARLEDPTSRVIGSALEALGVLTIAYNLANYLAVQRGDPRV